MIHEESNYEYYKKLLHLYNQTKEVHYEFIYDILKMKYFTQLMNEYNSLMHNNNYQKNILIFGKMCVLQYSIHFFFYNHNKKQKNSKHIHNLGLSRRKIYLGKLIISAPKILNAFNSLNNNQYRWYIDSYNLTMIRKIVFS